MRRRPRKQGRRGSRDAKWGDPYPETTPGKRATAAYFRGRPTNMRPSSDKSDRWQRKRSRARSRPAEPPVPSGTIGPRTAVLAATLCSRRRTLSSTDAKGSWLTSRRSGVSCWSVQHRARWPDPRRRSGWTGLGVERARAPSRQRRPSPLPTGRIRSEGAARALFLSGSSGSARFTGPVRLLLGGMGFVGGDEVRRRADTVVVCPGEREYGDIMACTVRDTSC